MRLLNIAGMTHELMQGNYYEVDGSIMRVRMVPLVGELIKKAMGMHTNGGQPVGLPITEEFLEERGFKLYRPFGTKERFFCKGEVQVATDGTNWRFLFKFQPVRDLGYVHELQNIYYWMTKEEI
jgi:hypothetical protein